MVSLVAIISVGVTDSTNKNPVGNSATGSGSYSCFVSSAVCRMLGIQ